MSQQLSSGVPTVSVPHFYLTARQRLGPGALLLATLAAAAAMLPILYALEHSGRTHFASGGASRSATAASGADSATDDDKDDPSKVDTIVLGDPADPPSPARPGNHISPVHPTILVRLPRFGDQVGLIPNTTAGRLLYDWLAAFNQANPAAISKALPGSLASTTDAQMELRHQTGGFNLVSAKEVQPGLLVFRLRDQTPRETESLGALQVDQTRMPPSIATFSLGAVPASGQNATAASR